MLNKDYNKNDRYVGVYDLKSYKDEISVTYLIHLFDENHGLPSYSIMNYILV